MNSAPLEVSQELDESFKKAVQDSSLRFIQVQIHDEKLEASQKSAGTSDVAVDYDSMKKYVKDQEACYFLFRVESGKEWLLISYVPDGVGVKGKMLSATAKGTLKTKLGLQYFIEEIHATNPSELSYKFYKGEKVVDARSESEKAHETILKGEQSEREERISQLNTSPAPGGGYHAVQIPISSSAKSKLTSLKDEDSINFLELIIAEGKEEIVEGQSAKLSPFQLKSHIHATEPRFYIYNYERTGAVSKTFVFIYSCPEKSPAKSRMVYSTSKPSVAHQVSLLGLSLSAKKIEISDGSELTEEFLRSEIDASKRMTSPVTSPTKERNAFLQEGGQTTKAKNVHTVEAHPIYSLMTNQGKDKKKIVMPPPGAYGGY